MSDQTNDTTLEDVKGFMEGKRSRAAETAKESDSRVEVKLAGQQLGKIQTIMDLMDELLIGVIF